MLSLAAGAFGRVRAVSAPLQRLFFGIYSSRSRGAEKEKPAPITAPYLPDASAKPSQTWASLMKRVFEIDPLVCKRCGCQMKIKTFITDQREVQQLINSLGLPAATAPRLG